MFAKGIVPMSIPGEPPFKRETTNIHPLWYKRDARAISATRLRREALYVDCSIAKCQSRFAREKERFTSSQTCRS